MRMENRQRKYWEREILPKVLITRLGGEAAVWVASRLPGSCCDREDEGWGDLDNFFVWEGLRLLIEGKEGKPKREGELTYSSRHLIREPGKARR